MFEKTLQDVVKGIRASKRDTALYISQCIAEIKTEINSSDMYIKANALQKLTFLHMMGYSMSWASFPTIEVMSSPRFAQKRIGYLAASQGFHKDTDVILLATNLLKKELRSANVGGSMAGVYEAGLAINCLSNIVTPELAQDLLPELTNLTAHPQPYLRKKAILCLFKLFVQYPQGLRLTFGKLQQNLNDPNPAVVSCAVNVITELSDKNPKNYLHLAPAFFDLLTNSSNNWMLIKVVKLLGSLVPEEPRLARKLLEPLAEIVKSTPAKSLLYEAAHAITKCLPYCRKSDGSMPASVPDIVALCAQTFKEFVQEQDQNLKYLGLVGFGSLMVSFPKVLSAPAYRPLILACLSDEDVTIRSRSLDLLPSMATRKNLVELVSQLLQHVALAIGEYKLELVAKVVEMCSAEKYSLLQDFQWYLDILFQLGHMRGLDAHAEMLRLEVTNVALRVLPIRAYAVKRSIEILLEGDNDSSGNDEGATVTSAITSGTSGNLLLDGDNGRGRHIMPEILPALAWIVGEYSDLLPEAISMDAGAVYIYNEDSEGPYHSVIQAITAPGNYSKLPSRTQSVYVQASVKLLAAASANAQVSDAELEACLKTLSFHLPVYMASTDCEVRERACTLHATLAELGLTSGFGNDSSAPGLMSLDDDEDSNDGVKQDGNLLGMPSAAPEKKGANLISDLDPLAGFTASSGGGNSLASKCRNHSELLNYLLKPSPMKPTGAKAQRKKQQNPIGLDGIDLMAPVDGSIFASLLEEEKALRAKHRFTMESVSFTQQRPMAANENKSIASDAISSTDMAGMGSSDFGAMGSSGTEQHIGSFQSTNPTPAPVSGNRPQSANDPFYLSSSAPMVDNDLTTVTNTQLPNKFGTIHLGDDDDADAAEDKKKKKKKKDKKHKHHVDIVPQANLGSMMGSGFGQNVTVYTSDDDDDDDVRIPPSRRGKGKGGAGKEFSGLAKVDLTTPLGEDEVMPERKHRVVPERAAPAATGFTDAPPPPQKHKKKKKESKRAKKAAKQQAAAAGDLGDLLGLGGFGSAAAPAPASQQTMPMDQAASGVMQSQSSAVNNAFDDLLGLANPAPSPALPTPTASTDVFGLTDQSNVGPSPVSPSGKSNKRPYLRAAIKLSGAAGSPVVDWSKVQLSFRVYRSSGANGPAVSISVRADNNMETSPLTNLVLRLKNVGDVPIGTIAPQSSAESSKIGPFSYPNPDSALEIKGTLDTSECSVPVKLALPVAVHLSPNESVTMDQVASELSSPEWAVHSAKIPLVAGVPVEKVKAIIGNFLHLAEVEPVDPMYGTFAGQSSSTGTPVRVLIKVKPGVVKVDIKSGNVNLGKAMASELKKLVL